MLDNLKNRFKDRFVIAWGLILVLVLLAVGAKFIFASQLNPSIDDVLSRSPQTGFDFSMFVASLLALSLATISAAKGYEILKRNHSLAGSVMCQSPEEDIAEQIQAEELAELRETIQKLERCCHDLGANKARLKQENHDLKEQLNKFSFDLGEVSRAEQMLRKSNISLSRECERQKSENEVLALRVETLESEPKVRLIKARTKTNKSPSRKRGKRAK